MKGNWNMISRVTATLLVGSWLVTTGCKSDCEKYFAKAVECAKDDEAKKEFQDNEEMFVAACEAAQDKEEIKTALECMKKHDGCKELEACVGEASSKRMAGETLEDIKKALEKGDVEKAGSECGTAYAITDDKPGDEVKSKCSDVLKKMAAKITKVRDEAGERDIGLCVTAESLAEKIDGADGKKKLETLCKEVSEAEDAKKTIAEAKKNLDAKKADMPYSCDRTVESLRKIGSDWGKKRADEVIKACFIDLGSFILESKAKETYCDFAMGEVVKAHKAFGIKDAKLTGLVEAAIKNAKCKTK